MEDYSLTYNGSRSASTTYKSCPYTIFRCCNHSLHLLASEVHMCMRMCMATSKLSTARRWRAQAAAGHLPDFPFGLHLDLIAAAAGAGGQCIS